jgi:hypothetical protein
VHPALLEGGTPPTSSTSVVTGDLLVSVEPPVQTEPNPKPTPAPVPAPAPRPAPLPVPRPEPRPAPVPDRPTPCPPTRDPKWDEICDARERLLECKKKVREESREGHAAWQDDVDVRPDGRNLRLYCRFSYLWQEKTRYCPRYCLEASDANVGATLEIKDCSGSSPLQKFRNEDGVIRPGWRGGEALCIRSDRLERCDKQLVYEREGNTDHFEIILNKEENFRHELCFSNPHHPKPWYVLDGSVSSACTCMYVFIFKALISYDFMLRVSFTLVSIIFPIQRACAFFRMQGSKEQQNELLEMGMIPGMSVGRERNGRCISTPCE